MAKKIDFGFEIDFNKIENENMTEFVSIVFDSAGYKNDTDFVVWNILGNYIYWWDGVTNAFYLCKKHVTIKGMQYYNQNNLIEGIKYLTQFKK